MHPMTPAFPPDEETPSPEELVPRGGTWHGLLFDNPNIGLPPGLTWSFEFAFGEVSRAWGTTPVSLTVDWVPLPRAAWQEMAGQAVACDAFAEPIECSAYVFEHFAYEEVRLHVLEQAGSRIRVAVEARGDLEGLGVPEWTVEQWLDFDGIAVQLEGVETAGAAARRLAAFTDVAGLVARTAGHGVWLVPRAAS